MATKDTNPKDALGIRKVGLSNVPMGPLLEVGLAMLEGGCKYGAHNYRDAGVRYKVYFDSTMRHMIDWWEGEDIDSDSGVHHVVKAIAGLMVLRDSMLCGNDVDDRPLRYPGGLNMAEFNGVADKILDKYPERKLPFTQKRRDYEIMDAARPKDMSELVAETIAVTVGEAMGESIEEVMESVGAAQKKMTELARETLKQMPPIGQKQPTVELPDENAVKRLSNKELTAIDVNIALDIDHPDREFYCDVLGCFERGKPNSSDEWCPKYLCPEHIKKEGDDNV